MDCCTMNFRLNACPASQHLAGEQVRKETSITCLLQPSTPEQPHLCTNSTRRSMFTVSLCCILQAPGPGEMLNSSAAARQQSSQQPGAGEDSMSVDALYKLIGAAKSERQSTLSPEQQAHVSRVQQRQLKQAAEAEAATIGAWLAQPRQQRCAVAEDDDCSSGCMCSDASYRAVSGAEQPRGSAGAAADHLHDAVDVEDSGLAMQAEAGITRSQHAATQQKLCKQHMAKQQQAVAPDTEEAAAGAAKQQRRCKYTRQEAETVVASQGQQADGAMQRGSRASCSSAGGGSASTQSACASSGGSSAGGVAAAVDGRNAGQGQSSTGALLRARHSAILHVAMMKAAAAADSQAAGCVQPGLKQQ
jgi:hypothetical protein